MSLTEKKFYCMEADIVLLNKTILNKITVIFVPWRVSRFIKEGVSELVKFQ